MTAIKVAMCLFKYFPYGGLQRDFVQIGRELKKRGHHIDVYTRSWEGEQPDFCQLHVLGEKGLGNHSKNHHFHQQMKAALDKKPVDIVFGFNKMPDLDVYYCADTCFATKAYEEKGPLYRLTPRSRNALAFEEAVAGKQAKTHTLLLSSAEGKALQKYYNTPPERLHLLPPGIRRERVWHDSSAELAQQKRKELKIDSNATLIAFVGSDYTRKGLDRLLLAIASLPDILQQQVKLLVIGRDKKLPVFAQQAKQLGIIDQVLFLGERDDVSGLLYAANYLAHPAYLENTGTAILEAVVAGAAVICSGICGYARFIEDYQLGWVIEEPFQQETMNRLFREMIESDKDWHSHCLEFARTADIYSSPQRAADWVEQIAATL